MPTGRGKINASQRCNTSISTIFQGSPLRRSIQPTQTKLHDFVYLFCYVKTLHLVCFIREKEQNIESVETGKCLEGAEEGKHI